MRQFAGSAARRIEALIERVNENTYRAFPLLKIVVEKRPGSNKTRTLLVPTVADRVLQTAAARQLSRSFEEEFLECSYGYRPGRSVDRAIARIRKCHELGYSFVVDGDITTFFDRVDHQILIRRLEARQPGEQLMGLLRQWIEAAVWDGEHVHHLRMGVPQGSPISPLLANFFLEEFDLELEKSGRKLVRYGDDFIILARTRDDAEQCLEISKSALEAAHLTLNREKTRIVDFEHGFHFLGALFEGVGIWVPWKHDRRKARILFMARPMPLAMRTRFEFSPPRNELQEAFIRAGATAVHAVAHASREPSDDERSKDVAFLYLTEQGAVLRKAGDRFLVEKDDEVALDLPYHKLENVLLFGNIQVTTQAMAELLEKGVSLSLFSRQGNFRGTLSPPRGKNVQLRIAQFERYHDSARALELAKAIVAAKVTNGLAVLAQYREKHDGGADYEQRRREMEGSLAALGGAADVARVDGLEGAAARAYFGAVMQFNSSDFQWPGRRKHPATDPLNALLSLAYTLLMNELTALLEGVGLDPYLGFLHQVDYGRPSLALDLVEAFRHPVADRLVLTTVNHGRLDADDFRDGGERPGVFLTPKALKRFFTEYEHWMLDKRATATAGEGPCFRERLKSEVEGLGAALRGGTTFEPFRYGRGEMEAACSTSSVTI